MYKQLFFVLTVLTFVSLACSVSVGNMDIGFRSIKGSGELTTKEYEVKDFSKFAFSGIGHVEVTLGETETLRLEAEDNLIEYFEIEVEGDTLNIGLRRNVTLRPNKDINFYLTVVDLDSISLSGLGDIDAPEFEGKRFDIGISGAGDVKMDGLVADELNIDISGLGSLLIDDGRVQKQTVEISGSGNYEGRGVQSEVVDVRLSGLGSAKVWADEILDVDISGAGSVSYYGEPQVSSDISGVGKLKHVDH